MTVNKSPGDYVFYFVDTIPEAPGALAYHDVDAHGVPYVFGDRVSDELEAAKAASQGRTFWRQVQAALIQQP